MATRSLLLRGVSYYDANKARLAGRLVQGAALQLISEPQNSFDSNGVVVRLSRSDEKIGYLSREIALAYKKALLEGRVISSKVQEVGYRDNSAGRSALRVVISVKLVPHAEAQPSSSKPNDTESASPFFDGLSTKGGVYELTNQLRGRTYIGSSSNIRKRIRQHLRDLDLGVHFNPHLQGDYASQRGRGFSAHAIELVASAARLAEAEERAIRKALRRGDSLYNMTSDGQGRSGAPTSVADPPPPVSDWTRRTKRRTFVGRGEDSGRDTISESEGPAQPPHTRADFASDLRKGAADTDAKPQNLNAWVWAVICLLGVAAVAYLVRGEIG